MPIRLLLADDHRGVAESLKYLIDRNKDMQIVGEAQDGLTAINMTCQLKPDVVIIDVSMPDLNGIEATKQIISQTEATKVIALSMHADKRFVQGMLKAGASGYILKDAIYDELARAIRDIVAAGKIYLSRGIAGSLIREYLDNLLADDCCTFTNAERQVLLLLADGKCAADIAATLDISIESLEKCRRCIREKLKTCSTNVLTSYAIQEVLTPVTGK